MASTIYTDGVFSITRVNEYKYELYKCEMRFAMGDWLFVSEVAERHGISGAMIARQKYLSH